MGEDASDNVDSDEYLFFSLVGTGTGALEILLLLKNDESLPVVDWTSGGGAGLGWAGFLYVTFSNPFTNALGKGDTAGWLGMEFFLSVDEERERDCEPRRAFFCWYNLMYSSNLGSSDSLAFGVDMDLDIRVWKS